MLPQTADLRPRAVDDEPIPGDVDPYGDLIARLRAAIGRCDGVDRDEQLEDVLALLRCGGAVA